MEEDDLYSGYNNAGPSNFGPTSTGGFNAGYSKFSTPSGTVMQQPLGTAMRGSGLGMGGRGGTILQTNLRQGTAARRGLNSQMGRAADGESARPMTSVRAAGYSSAGPRGPRPLGDAQASRGPAPPLVKKSDGTPEDQAREMEKGVNRLLEESAIANADRDYPAALTKAKEAAKKERLLCKHREQNGMADQMNIDLTYSVLFNLANQYDANEMYAEALKTYTLLVKNKQYTQSGRLRVNMGNIYFAQKNYPAAIKMYRMALDQIPQSTREVRFRITRNIGISFTRLGQYQDAVTAFEGNMEASPDYQSGFNLVVCYFALGNKDRLKKAFAQLLSVHDPAMAPEDEHDAEEAPSAEDDLKKALKEKRKIATRYITQAAKLISPIIDKDFVSGFDYVVEQLRSAGLTDIASEMEISKAVFFLKQRAVDKAKEALMAFERREDMVNDTTTRARAATNLCYLYFLEGDIKNADKFGTMAIKADRYNAKALVNKGNCEFIKGVEAKEKNKSEDAREYMKRAKELYMEAIATEADCTEAIHNLGLVKKETGLNNEALSAFSKLHSILPNSAEVIFQLATLNEAQGNMKEATRWFKSLIERVPTDAAVLARFGAMITDDDDAQRLHYHSESYRHYPVDMEVISWLGAYFVKSEMYEKAMTYFMRASQIQPKEVKWRLMVASCHRRIGSFQKALKIYEEIEKEHPDNTECLNYLVRICTDLGMHQKVEEYATRLSKAERKQARTQATFTQQQQQMRAPAVAERMDYESEDRWSPSEGMRGGGGYGGGRLDASAAVAEAARGGADASKMAVRKQTTNEDDWADGEDVTDLLPE